MTETINGFTLRVPGEELIQLCKNKSDNAKARLSRLPQPSEKVQQMAPEDRELAGFKTRGRDMADEVEKKIKTASDDFLYFTFASIHLEPEATYRLGKDDLRLLGIQPGWR